MIIFLDEEASYLSWIAHHRHGFVLDWLRKPTRKQPVLHRASCAEIRGGRSKRTHWTTGRHLKACSLDLAELVAWAEGESGDQPACCRSCRPTDKSVATAGPQQRRLTKLGRQVVDYVVEAAVIHLDQADGGYRVTVGDVARALDKTPRQIAPALLRLVGDGYLRLDGGFIAGAALSERRRIYPTEAALRTLPAFAKMSKRKINVELRSLAPEER